jgi:hypothetical protein
MCHQQGSKQSKEDPMYKSLKSNRAKTTLDEEQSKEKAK